MEGDLVSDDTHDKTYRIERVFQSGDTHELIAEGITYAEATAHCSDPETSSATATSPEARLLTAKKGDWMDVLYEEGRTS